MGAEGSAQAQTVYDRIAGYGEALGIGLCQTEVGVLATEHSLTQDQLEAVATVLAHAAEERRRSTVDTLVRTSRLPSRAPKSFANFDFSRIQGRDAEALLALPTLSHLYARRNVAFVGPSGVGKTHLAESYARACCERGMKSYVLKANELRDKLEKAVRNGTASRAVTSLVRPSCLVVDGIGRCTLDRACTDLFFDVVDRRCEKDGPNTMILTSTEPASKWGDYFTGDDALLRALDRIFDRAAVYVIKGSSYRGSQLLTFSVETAPPLPAVRATGA